MSDRTPQDAEPADTPAPGQDWAHQVVVCWPTPDKGFVLTRGVTTHHAETGELLPAVTRVQLDLGGPNGPGPGPVSVEITELCDVSGRPFRTPGYEPVMSEQYRAHRKAVWDRFSGRPMTEALVAELDAVEQAYTGPQYLTVTARYAVAAMRIVEPDPTPLTLPPAPDPDPGQR